jgi:hypothetical protein
MLPKSVIACLSGAAFIATNALMPTGVSAASRGGLQPGTYNWPPYAESGNLPGTICGHVWIHPYRHKPAKGQWVYQCH